MTAALLAAALLVLGGVMLALWIRGQNWRRAAMRERGRADEAEQADHEAEELAEEQGRSDREALDEWRRNFK